MDINMKCILDRNNDKQAHAIQFGESEKRTTRSGKCYFKPKSLLFAVRIKTIQGKTQNAKQMSVS